MPRPDFAVFLAASLEALAREAPGAHRRMCAALDGDAVLFTVDGADVSVTCVGGDARIARGVAGAGVRVRTSTQDILALIDGEVSLAGVIEDERLWLQGPLDALGRFHDGLQSYLDGAVRAPAFPVLLERLRAAVRPGEV